jgi:ribosomal protein S27E
MGLWWEQEAGAEEIENQIGGHDMVQGAGERVKGRCMQCSQEHVSYSHTLMAYVCSNCGWVDRRRNVRERSTTRADLDTMDSLFDGGEER